MTQKNRDVLIDVLKGFTIILVVLGHSIQLNVPDFTNNLAFSIIYSFHMPLFMFLSGYVSYYSISRNSLPVSIGKRIRNLLIPYLSWTFLFALIIGQLTFESIVPFARILTRGLDNSLWFLLILFFAQIILIVCAKLTKFNSKVELILLTVVPIIVYLLPFHIFSFHELQYYLPFVIIGYLVSKHKDFLRKNIKYIQEGAFILAVILLIIHTHTYISEAIQIKAPFFANAWRAALTTLTALTLISITAFAFRGLKNEQIQRFLSWIGQYTLDIYAIHSYAITAFAIGIFHENNLLAISANTVLLIVLSIVFSNIILRKSRVLKFLFLGQ